MTLVSSILTYVHALAIAILVGKVIFLSFIVAPLLARTLAPASFSQVVRNLFPAYYTLGIGTAIVGYLATLALGMVSGFDSIHVVGMGLWMGVLLLDSYCRTPLTPQLNQLRDQLNTQEFQGYREEDVRKKWEELHRLSVAINTVVLLLGLGLVGLI